MKRYTHSVKGIDPIADAFAGTVYTDIFSMRNHKTAEVLVYVGVGATGTSTITVEASDDVSGTTTSAIPFYYQEVLSGDTHGTLTQATTAGFTTTAGSSKIVKLYINASDIGATGYEFCRVKFVEVVNSAVLGGVLIQLLDARFESSVQATAIV
ncbi:MAG: hypothetical protein KC517_09220 [Bacteroidetes bacterium]|nr:hypothetical protein [Bacteroidota bacterium]